MNGGYPVKRQYSASTPVQLLPLDVTALVGVNDQQKAVLQDLGVHTIQDLGASLLFGTARKLVDVAGTAQASAPAAGDYLDVSAGTVTFAKIVDESPKVLRMVSEHPATKLRDQFGITTIGELASWPPYTTARQITADAYGTTSTVTGDSGRPDDLIPVARRYATERVQYDVLVLHKMLDAPARELPPYIATALSHRLHAFGDVFNTDRDDLRIAGAIDVAGLVSATLLARPAIGAVLTFRQSWFPHALTIGHLLHSTTLAPGEATRIALVDWTRAVRASTDEVTAQMEAVASDVTHNRALSEVSSAVAAEAQSGFSSSKSQATQSQNAFQYGKAKAELETPGLFGSLGASLFGGSLGGASTTSLGVSSGSAASSGWASTSSSSRGNRSVTASMMQNVSDRTHQASSSTRNRRATTVVETSQRESEALTTRVLANYNHMHALTVEYFEVVQIYRVILEMSEWSPCLFVPMQLVTFNDKVIHRYRSVMAAAGLIPEVRGLALLEPSEMLVVAHRRVGPWEDRWLNEARGAIGAPVAAANDTAARLPLQGLALTRVGSLDTRILKVVSDVEVTLTSGGTFLIPVADAGTGQGGWAQCGASLSSLPTRDIAGLSLVRKPENEFGDQGLQISLEFDFTPPSGDRHALRLVAPVKPASAQETLVPIFELGTTISSDRLRSHLEENALHYSSAIWRSLDAASITTLLATYKLDNRQLIEVIDPVPVTVTGNYLVFRYYGLDKEGYADLQRTVGEERPLEDMVPLPSGGLFAEAVLGRSNSAEKLDITRFWNWQDSPIPIPPPEIESLKAGGKADDDVPATGRLESPIVNVVTPPALPDPTGLAPLYQAIANGNMFRDMSGLAQTAALTQAALQAAQAGAANATEAAGEAQQIAANQLTEMLKLAAQVALAAVTSGAGGAIGAVAGGAAGAALGSGKPGVANTPSNAGALINHGKDLDDRGSDAAPAPARGDSTTPGAGEASGGTSGGGAPGGGTGDAYLLDAGITPTNEGLAFGTALGAGTGIMGIASRAILDTTLGQAGGRDAGAAPVAVPADAVDRAIRMELSVPYMYLDSKGFVTIGVGHMLADSGAAAKLDLRHNADAAAATDKEKRDEYVTLASKTKNQGYTYYKQFTTLHLTDEAIKALLAADLQTVVDGLRRNLPDYDTYPAKAQEALIDMAFNLGVAGLMKKFPKFVAAVKRRDWATAATESNRPDVSRDRNAEVRKLLEDAAKP